MIDYAPYIPLIPLAASLIILFVGTEDEHSPMPYLALLAMGTCLIISSSILWRTITGGLTLPVERSWTWFSFPASLRGSDFLFELRAGVLIDAPAAFMLVVVTLVSFLVQLYSLGYMVDAEHRRDPRFKRYFAYLSFFTASMLGLVVSNNLLVTFACWELVGVSSYLLIGFWFEKPGPAYACKKAFITTKLGDIGFSLALLLIFVKGGTFQISLLHNNVVQGMISQAALAAIGLGLLAGAAGKSAQFPLFIWLPDAMEGPTPVSALIHAATMVAAGIYLVAKCYFIFAASPLAMDAAAWAGLLTALLAASMALVAYDIKRVLAFSTVSQLGFMMCALGCAGYTAGLFHLTTHAFFKALLFLGAGSVIHAVHTNDMRSMGGLSKRMPLTFMTMAIGTLAIAGIPPLAGYYSKDLILEKVFERSPFMFGVLAFSACLTAFYMFRMLFLTFWGDARDRDKFHHAKESTAVMTTPLVILAFLSVVSGWALEHRHTFARLVTWELPRGHHHADPRVLAAAVTAAVIASIALSWKLYADRDFSLAESLKARFQPAFNLLDRRYFLDDFFLGLVALSDRLAGLCAWVDLKVIDEIFVDGWGLMTRIWSEISNVFDVLFVDRTVDGFGDLSRDLGSGLRGLVSHGQVQEYLMYLAIAVSLFATMILNRP